MRVPPGVGSRQAVVVTTAGGLQSNADGASLSYSRPEIISISPSYVFAGRGTQTIRIEGRHFGNAAGDLDGVSLVAPGMDGNLELGCASSRWINPFAIDCTVEALDLLDIQALGISGVEAARLRSGNQSLSPGPIDARTGNTGQQSVAVAVSMQVGGQSSELSASTPTLLVLGKPSVSLVSPSFMATSGSVGTTAPVQIIGAGFGVVAADVHRVTIGGKTCRHVQFVSDGELRVSMPPGAGKDLAVVVRTRGGLASETTLQSRISYSPPSVDAVTPSHIFAANRSALTIVRIVGSNFGPSGTIDAMGGAMLDQVTCNITQQNHTFLECTVNAKDFDRYPELFSSSDGASSGRLSMVSPVSARIAVVVSAAQQETTSVAGPTNSLEVVGRPQVSLINPRVIPTGGSHALDGATGVANVVVLGNGFGTSPGDVLDVTVGGQPCPSVIWASGTELRVTIPPGVGKLQAMQVRTRGGLTSLSTNEGSFVQYRQSIVSSITPTYSMTGNLQSSFSIRGTDFGNRPQDVEGIFVGG